MLRLAALDHLVDARVDADAMRSERLRPRPAPDLLLAGCRKLGIEPGEAVAVTHSGPGIVAAGRAGLAAIGIAAGAQADILRDFGAARVVTSLSALLR
jgi:beta-phosphoglucomutase-like phosphatase (HAD superfamily)